VSQERDWQEPRRDARDARGNRGWDRWEERRDERREERRDERRDWRDEWRGIDTSRWQGSGLMVRRRETTELFMIFNVQHSSTFFNMLNFIWLG
jgi:hypothetical protein